MHRAGKPRPREWRDPHREHETKNPLRDKQPGKQPIGVVVHMSLMFREQFRSERTKPALRIGRSGWLAHGCAPAMPDDFVGSGQPKMGLLWQTFNWFCDNAMIAPRPAFQPG